MSYGEDAKFDDMVSAAFHNWRDEIYFDLERLSDDKLIKKLSNKLNSDNYIANEYTNMAKNIIDHYMNYGNITDNQRKAVMNHLVLN